jgi:hypothetical protein
MSERQGVNGMACRNTLMSKLSLTLNRYIYGA